MTAGCAAVRDVAWNEVCRRDGDSINFVVGISASAQGQQTVVNAWFSGSIFSQQLSSRIATAAAHRRSTDCEYFDPPPLRNAVCIQAWPETKAKQSHQRPVGGRGVNVLSDRLFEFTYHMHTQPKLWRYTDWRIVKLSPISVRSAHHLGCRCWWYGGQVQLSFVVSRYWQTSISINHSMPRSACVRQRYIKRTNWRRCVTECQLRIRDARIRIFIGYSLAYRNPVKRGGGRGRP